MDGSSWSVQPGLSADVFFTVDTATDNHGLLARKQMASNNAQSRMRNKVNISSFLVDAEL